MSDNINSLRCRCSSSNPNLWKVYRWPEQGLILNITSGITFTETGYDNYAVRCPVCMWSHFVGRYISEKKQAQIYSDLQKLIELMKKAQESEATDGNE